MSIKSIRCVFSSLSNIYDADICNNGERVEATILTKCSSIDVWHGSECTSENSRCSDNNIAIKMSMKYTLKKIACFTKLTKDH